MIDFSKVKVGMKIRYVGTNIFKFEDDIYTLQTAESSYINPDRCPMCDREKIGILEITTNDNILFFTTDRLYESEWELVE